MKKSLLAAAIVVAVPTAGVSLPAFADNHAVSANVSLVSDYRYRGISQSARKPAVQGGFDFEHESGFYAGVWGSSISWLGTGSGAEIDLYTGYAGEVGEFSYDVGLLHYNYPGGKEAGATNPNTTEAYVGGGWGPLSLQYSYSFTDLFGADDSKGSTYIVAGLAHEVVEGVTLEASVGRQRIKNALSYTDYSLGATMGYAGFDFGLHYIDTNLKGVEDAKGRLVASISRSF